MKKRIKVILIILIILLCGSKSCAKYQLVQTAKVFHINKLERKEPTVISGKIFTENYLEIHKSLVILYKTNDTRSEDDVTNPRKVIAQAETNDDGSFSLEVEDIEEYDIVVKKQGYLEYRVTNIKVKDSEETVLKEYKLIAGDLDGTGEIEISDLIYLNDNIQHYVDSKCDLNEDGVVDRTDQNILRANFGKATVTEEWGSFEYWET